MSLYVVNIHGEIEGDYEIIGKYEPTRTGKWIEICPMVVDGGLAKRIKCSECGDERLDYFISKRYCPNCGAKMEGVRE